MWRLALALVVLLAACSESDKKRVLEVLEHEEVVGGIARVLAKSDTLMVSDALSIDGTPSLTEYECITETNTCTRDSVPLFDPVDTLAELITVTANPDVERSDIRQHNGIDLAEYSVTETRPGAIWTTSHYGAWLDYSAFETSIARGLKTDNVNVLAAYSISFGQRTPDDAPPLQDGATWEGMMLGHTRGPNAVDALQGDATIAFEFDAMTVDVLFSNITYVTTGADFRGGDIPFNGIQVGNGAFTDRTATAHIAGRFYGPAHEEVGGVFTWPTALGAFGARKQ